MDVLGPEVAPSPGLGQDLMLTRVVPAIYERWWRPALGQVAKGLTGPTMGGEHRIALEMLALGRGDVVLDVACGPGNFTRAFAAAVAPGGLAVGVDASPTMLDRALADTERGGLAYLRADATDLPLPAGAVDAACCFAALNLMADPFGALAEMDRVLRPGGRVALFTSCRRGFGPGAPLWWGAFGRLAGMTIFERDVLTGFLRERGYEDVRQRVAGVTQFVGARKGGGGPR